MIPTESLALLGGAPVRRTPFPSWPQWGEAERNGLMEVLASEQWSAATAPKVTAFERAFAEAHQARHGIAVTNGTITLEIALAALGVGHGDEVIVPPYTFLATASAVLKVGGIPVFADLDPETLCLDPQATRKAITRRTKAIIPVHLGGHPADMDAFLAIQRETGIPIIEDAAHAPGAIHRNRKVGSIGAFGSFSFQGSKNMTCGEGGILLTNDDELARLARSLQNCGRREGGPWYLHERLGGNYRLPEFLAALLLGQLGRLEEQAERREAFGRHLDKGLVAIPGIQPLPRQDFCTRHAYHLYIFRYNPETFSGLPRDRFLTALQAEGVPCSSGYPFPLDRNPLFAERQFDLKSSGFDRSNPATDYGRLPLPVCERACAEVVWLPHNVLLGSIADADDVIAAVAKVERLAHQLGIRDISAK